MFPKPEFLDAQLIVSAITIFIVVHLILGGVAYCIFFERKTSAWMQDRIGPNRCGFDFGLPLLQKLFGNFKFWGAGQALADGVKFLVKEDYTPPAVDKALFTLAPMIAVIPALIGFAIVPWGGYWVTPEFTIPVLNWTIESQRVLIAGANISIGLIYMLAVGSLAIYAVALGGWASNNKYSMLGGLRASSQMLAYEIPMGLSILCVLLMVGSLLPTSVIQQQQEHGWMILTQPVVAGLFFMCVLAECNRAPFDNAECEQELVGGYHTEYSSMRFALFFLGEYAHMITGCAIFAVLFLGGFSLSPLPFVFELPGLSPDATGLLAVLAKFGVMFVKVCLLIGFMMVVRWTLPRLRFDQVMSAAWTAVIPIALGLVLLNSALVYLGVTSAWVWAVSQIGLAGVVIAVQPLLPRPTNHKIPLAGSRFSPLAGADVLPSAREDFRTRTTPTTAAM